MPHIHEKVDFCVEVYAVHQGRVFFRFGVDGLKKRVCALLLLVVSKRREV